MGLIMKTEYITPEIEIIEFKNEDIIATSQSSNELIDFPITTLP